jgi:hypothetical protein
VSAYNKKSTGGQDKAKEDEVVKRRAQMVAKAIQVKSSQARAPFDVSSTTHSLLNGLTGQDLSVFPCVVRPPSACLLCNTVGVGGQGQ